MLEGRTRKVYGGVILENNKDLSNTRKEEPKQNITEKDILPTLQDFQIFIDYIASNKVKLTKNRQELGKKDSFAINSLLSNSKDVEEPRYLQSYYPTISLFFHIALKIGIFEIDYSKSSVQYLMATSKLQQYKALNNYNKYMLLFKTYWTLLDFEDIYAETREVLLGFMCIEDAFMELSKATAGEKIVANMADSNYPFHLNNAIDRFFVAGGALIHHLSVFGFWAYEEAGGTDTADDINGTYVKTLTPTSLGISMMKGCLERPMKEYNVHLRQVYPKAFEKAYLKYFPPNVIDLKVINNVLENQKSGVQGDQDSTYIFKVSLNNQIWRRIRMPASSTFEDLHDMIQAAFDFDDDHLFAFFMDGKAWSHKAYWDERSGDKPSASKAVLHTLNLIKGKKFLYLFDFGDEWRFDVILERIMDKENSTQKAEIIEIKGQSPAQYPDWDDFEEEDDIDELEEDMMLDALRKLHEDVEKSISKRELELWKEIEAPFTLSNFLQGLTKSELTAIRQKLGLSGVSGLKKGELVEVLESQMEGLMKKTISQLDDNQYKVIKKAAKHNGIVEMELPINQVEFYRGYGVLFSGTINGQRALIMPKELISAFEKLDQDFQLHKKIEKNTEWIRITQGLLYYYGTLKANTLLDLLSKYTSRIEFTEYLDFFEVLENAREYYREIGHNEVGYFYYRVFKPEQVLEEHKKRDSLDYYPFSYDELYKAGIEGFVDKNTAFCNFVKFLMRNYTIPMEAAESLVEECVYLIQINESPQNMIDFLKEHLEINHIQVLQEVMQQLFSLSNNTRQWEIKGYMPSELATTEEKYLQPIQKTKLRTSSNDEKQIKIGRNDLCSCGSGKKYKRCCGK